MPGELDGLRILVPETRELDLFANMLEAEGARILRCPLVRILDLDDTTEARAWLDMLVAGRFQDVVWLTGEGIRRLLALSDRHGQRDVFIRAIGAVRSITRGPKPVRALKELGIAPGLAAPVPTSEGILDALAGENIADRIIGLQLYPGDGGSPLLAELRTRGANVFPVTPYRYAAETDTADVASAIEKLTNGDIDIVAFTSSPQVDRLFEVARGMGREQELIRVLNNIRVAAVGPVVEDALRQRGIASSFRPRSQFHLKPLVREIIANQRRTNS